MKSKKNRPWCFSVQRIAKGAMGALQLAGGVLQVAGGIALSSTGLGAVLGVPVAAHGAGDVVQGGLKLVNAIFRTNIKEVNPVQEAYRAVGGLIGGEKGKAIADKVFGITDLALGFVNVQKAVTNVAKIKNVFNAADKLSTLKTFIKQSDTAKFIKNIPQMLVSAPTKAKNLAKNAIDITVNTFNKGRNAVQVAIKGATNLAADATAAVKRFTSSFKNAAASVIGGARKSTASDSGLKIDLQLFAKKSADKVDDVATGANKTQTGSYTIEFDSGKKYHGKGPVSRMEQSAKEKSAKYNDSVKSKDWTSAKNDREADLLP
ncbi:MAG: DUF4225 domain-containing protein [Bacillota bacterium]